MSVVDIAAAAIIQSLAGPVDGSDLLNLSNQLPGRHVAAGAGRVQRS